uniref:Uncharacterized protein n=1 Tax=Arundo donax TaxID=35708 RepID=A0A0A9C7Z2_ARUDO
MKSNKYKPSKFVNFSESEF